MLKTTAALICFGAILLKPLKAQYFSPSDLSSSGVFVLDGVQSLYVHPSAICDTESLNVGLWQHRTPSFSDMRRNAVYLCSPVGSAYAALDYKSFSSGPYSYSQGAISYAMKVRSDLSFALRIVLGKEQIPQLDIRRVNTAYKLSAQYKLTDVSVAISLNVLPKKYSSLAQELSSFMTFSFVYTLNEKLKVGSHLALGFRDKRLNFALSYSIREELDLQFAIRSLDGEFSFGGRYKRRQVSYFWASSQKGLLGFQHALGVNFSLP